MAEVGIGYTAGSGTSVDGFSLPDGKVQEAVAVGDGVHQGRILVLDANGAARVIDADPHSTNVAKWSAKQYPYVEMDPTTLLYEGFSAALDTTNTWQTVGTAPTASAGSLTFNAGTVANAQSIISSIPSFPMPASGFLRYGALVTLAAGAETGSKAWWGVGSPAGSPTEAVPLANGCVFETVDADGSLVGAIYSNGVRTASTALAIPAQESAPALTTGRPTDGALHRYAVDYRASRVYFSIDDIVVGSVAAPNPQMVNLPWTAGVINGSSTLGSARTITITTASVADTTRNGAQISDATFLWRKLKVDALGNAATAQNDLTASGSITALNSNLATGAATAGSTVALALGSGQAAVAIQVTGTFVATLVLQGTVDGTNWITLNYTGAMLNVNSAASVTSIAAVGIVTANVAGMTSVRLTCSAFTSGTAVVTMRASTEALAQAIAGLLPGYPSAVTLSDGQTNTTSPTLGVQAEGYNGASWDRTRNNFSTNTGDSGAKTVTFNGATQTNYNGRGVTVLLNLGTVSGTTPTLVAQLQGSSDGGTTWYNIPGAVTASITATGTYGITCYPGATVVAGTATSGSVAVASHPLPRAWRVQYTIGGTTPSFTLTNVQACVMV